MGLRQSPGVLAFLAMQGVCLLASQKIRGVVVSMMILARRQSREVRLAGDFSLVWPWCRWSTGDSRSCRQMVCWEVFTIAVQVHREIFGTDFATGPSVDPFEGSGELQLLLTAGSDSLLENNRALVEFDVAHKGRELHKMLVATRAVDILFFRVELQECQYRASDQGSFLCGASFMLTRSQCVLPARSVTKSWSQ